MPRPSHPLRFEFETALLAYIQSKGEDFERSALVQSYVDRGVSQSTVYRWVDTVLANMAVSPSKASATPQRTLGAPAVDDHPLVVEKLPPLPEVDGVGSDNLIPVMDLLRDCVEQARNLMEHARNPDGTIRNARLLLHGSQYLVRAAETGAKLNATIGAQQEMEQFQAVLMEEVSTEVPEVQQRILIRLRRVCDAAVVTDRRPAST
jgi:hypothetical protein